MINNGCKVPHNSTFFQFRHIEIVSTSAVFASFCHITTLNYDNIDYFCRMKNLMPIITILFLLASCGKRHVIDPDYPWPASGVAEADSMMLQLERYRSSIDYTRANSNDIYERFCSIASLHPENKILQMRRLYVEGCTLLQYDNIGLRQLLAETMPQLDSAASPYDWHCLRTLRLINEKSIYTRYKEASENIEFFKDAGSDIELAKNYEILGNVMCEINDFEKSNEYYDIAENLYDKAGAEHNKYVMKIGRACAAGGERELEMLRELLDNDIIRRDPALYAAVLQNAYIMLDSLPLLDKAIATVNTYSLDKSRLPVLYAYKAYNMLTDNDIEGALNLIDKLDSLSLTYHPTARNQELICAVKAEVYDAAGMKDKCIEAMDDVTWWSDSTIRESNIPVLYAQETRKLIDTAQRNNKLERQNSTLILVSIILLLLTGGIAAFFIIRNRMRQRRREITLLDEKIENAYNVQLAQSTILQQSNNILADIDKAINDASAGNMQDAKLATEIRRILNVYKSNEGGRDGLLKVSANVDSKFVTRLKADFPDLSENLLRLASLIAAGVDSHQLATTLNISPKSLYTSRYRLRSRLGLAKEDSLEDFLRKYI